MGINFINNVNRDYRQTMYDIKSGISKGRRLSRIKYPNSFVKRNCSSISKSIISIFRNIKASKKYLPAIGGCAISAIPVPGTVLAAPAGVMAGSIVNNVRKSIPKGIGYIFKNITKFFKYIKIL